MKISDNGLNFIKQHEELKLKAYQDQKRGGKWTIGYGHTKNVKPGMVIDEDKANELLHNDLSGFENRVNTLVKSPLNQNQYDALVSFDFNTGGLRYKDKKSGQQIDSKVLKHLNNGNYDAGFNAMNEWNHVTTNDGRKIESKGLINRRSAENELANKPVQQQEIPSPAQQQMLQQAIQPQQQGQAPDFFQNANILSKALSGFKQ